MRNANCTKPRCNSKQVDLLAVTKHTKFKLYTDVTYSNCLLHSNSEVHVIIPSAENSPFLLVQAVGSAMDGEQKSNRQNHCAECLQ